MKHPMLWLAGADERVLAKCPERERTKQIGVGGTVLTTAVLATLSATYVIHARIGAPLGVAIAAGVLWGLAIMNLDRWLQVTLRRQRNNWLTLASGVPRVILAVIVGVVISEPLVLAIYHNEVGAQAQRNQDRKLTTSLNRLGSAAEIKQLKQERDALQKGLHKYESGSAATANPEYQRRERELGVMKKHLTEARHNPSQRQLARQLAQKVTQAGTALVRFGRKVDREAKAKADAADKEATAQLKTLGEELTAQQKLHDDAAARLRKKYSHVGLLDQEEALSDLTSANGSLRFNRFMLQLLIICLDSLPVFVKLMLLFGKESIYDQMLSDLDEVDYDQAMHGERLRAEGEMRTQTLRAKAEEIESDSVIVEATLRQQLQQDALQDLTKSVVDAQKEVAQKRIDEWKDDMLASGSTGST
jgi:hypothetical protein